VIEISIGTCRKLLTLPLLIRGLDQSGWRRVHHPHVSRCVEFQRDGPCRRVRAGAGRVGVYDTRRSRAVAVRDIKAQSGTVREGTERMDRAAMTTHLDGIEMSDECKGRIQAPHEEWN
jgi:hypothetical protein